jgi:hypothetical protein
MTSLRPNKLHTKSQNPPRPQLLLEVFSVAMHAFLAPFEKVYVRDMLRSLWGGVNLELQILVSCTYKMFEGFSERKIL